jgi:branched-chain amino acid transport system ATP-binding protein
MLKIDALSAGYGGAMINRGVSFDVAKGEIVAVIGRNGVGKSTLAKAVMGLLKAMVGSVILEGRNVTRLGPDQRARLGIGYVPQGRGIFADLTVEENLRTGCFAGRERRSVEYGYELFPLLGERRWQLGGTLSGGQQQMLSIARALMSSPKLLLLDEPSDGIQPNIVEQIGELCMRLNQENDLTVLLIEQNLDLIMACASRCMVMEKGTITATLSPADLADPEIARKALAV